MRIIDVLTSPWAIKPEVKQEIIGIYQSHLRGEKIDWKGLTTQFGIMMSSEDDGGMEIDNGVAIIPLKGVISKTETLMSWLFGGCSTEDIGRAFDEALQKQSVFTILFDIDSPGGTVDGTEELCNKIFAARGQKLIIAYSDGNLCSGAYWIGSAADKIFISGGTVEVGSIAVLGSHVDQSEFDKAIGVKWTEITSGPYKRIASGHKPLSKEGATYLQEQVDYLAAIFTEQSLLRNRKMAIPEATEISQGATFFGQQAIDNSLVDGVSTKGTIIDLYGDPNSIRTIRAMVKTRIEKQY